MNITICSAVLSSIQSRSPLISRPLSREFSFLKIEKSRFAKSFSPILTGRMPSLYQISNSKFSDILNSAIILDSTELNGTTFNQKQKINSSISSITNCQFIRCIQQNFFFNSVEGGAILIRGLIVSISDCIFRQNQVSQIGAAIRVSSSAKFSVDKCLIAENNATYYCAGISLFHVFESSITNNNFTFNFCKGQVSALMLTRCLNSVLDNNIFVNNTAKSNAATYIEISNAQISSFIYISNTASVATSLIVTKYSNTTVNNTYFSDLAKQPSVFVSEYGAVNISNSFFGGVLKDEVVKDEDGESITEDCEEGQKKEIELENLTSISVQAETEEVRQDYIPNFLGAAHEHNTPLSRHTFVEEVDHGLDKSTIMIIAYAIVIMMLIVGLRMYFNGNGATQQGVSTSIFGDEDDDDNLADNFMHDKDDPNKIGEKPEMEKLVGKDVPLELESEL